MTNELRGPGPIYGLWSATAHSRIVEVAGSLRPDYVCVDVQHGPDLGQLSTSTFDILSRFGVPGLVRVTAIDSSDIGRALDLGAAGIMAPMVETAEDAELFARSCRYAPDGIRSYGMQTMRVDPFALDYKPICAVQIETTSAVENLDQIAAVEGIDWLYIGPADLGLSLGGVPAPDVSSVFDGSHPLASQLQEAFKAVVEAATANEKLPGIHCGSGEAAAVAMEQGFAVASVTSDLSAAHTSMAEQLERARR